MLDHVAISRATYADDAAVGQMTADLVGRGASILQSHKLGATDEEHVARLFDFFGFPEGAEVLDAGCGVGAVPSRMARLRPDLRFTLLNVSPAQLALAPYWMPRIAGDVQDMPFAPGSFDGVMFNYILGHTDLRRSFQEAARVLRKGGVCAVYDLTSDEPEHVVERVGYRPYSRKEIEAAVFDAGFCTDVYLYEPANYTTADFTAACGPDALVDHGFDRTRPIIYRLVK